jgi:MFS family permease
VSISATVSDKARSNAVESDVPARLDRLPWSRFHWLLVSALGVTWILDGLEVTVVGSIGPMLEYRQTLGLTPGEIGLAGTLYLAGALIGAVVFGHLTDRLGRKRLFTVTLAVYVAGAVLTALSWEFWSFAAFRFVTGLAIGGEYSAINSAIDELIPARVRGRVDLIVNGTFWLGAALGALASLLLLDWVPMWLGWRLAFGLGALVAVAMVLARHYVPESPRWLLTHGRGDEAHKIMDDIETMAVGEHGKTQLPSVQQRMTFRPVAVGFDTILHTIFVRYRARAFLGLVLIVAQAFFFNGITFTYPLVLKQYFHVLVFPLEMRALTISLFSVVGTGIGGLLAPTLFGMLIDTDRRGAIAAGHVLGAALMIAAAVVELILGVASEGKSLEDVASPLSMERRLSGVEG